MTPRICLVMAATAVAALSAGCSEESFAERDPEGYKACSMHAEYSDQTDAATKIGGGFEVGEQARKAATKAIRDVVTPLFDEEALEASGQANDFPMVDAEALEAACEEEGFEF